MNRENGVRVRVGWRLLLFLFFSHSGEATGQPVPKELWWEGIQFFRFLFPHKRAILGTSGARPARPTKVIKGVAHGVQRKGQKAFGDS